MTRRRLMLAAGPLALGLGVLAARGLWWAPELPARNVLLVTVDTLRADAVGAYGGPGITPNLDRLAGEGLVYLNAHAHNVVTLPSHTNILTGLYPFAHGVRENAGFTLSDGFPTLATRLKAEGFATGAFVGAAPLDSRFGLDRGFDVYDDRYPSVPAGGTPLDFALPERRGEEVVSAAREWLDRRPAGERWFCWVHLFDPHAPYRPPEPYASRFHDRPYLGEVAYADAVFGSLLDRVRGLPGPTLIVVTADHGEALGDHGELTHGLFAYEATLRVPLILHLPGAIRPGTSGAPAGHVDILPTVLELTGAPPSSPLPATRGEDGSGAFPGRSLLGPKGHEAPLYFEALSAALNRGWAPLRGVIVHPHKAVELPVAELYDLAEDPAETVNLAAGQADRYTELTNALAALAGGGTLPAAGTSDPELVRQLQALGYLAGTTSARGDYGPADDPKNLVHLDAAIHRGIDQYQRGELEAAMATYRSVLAERPDMLLAATNLAFLQYRGGDVDGAIRTLEEGLRTAAPPPSTLALLASYLTEAGRSREAIRLLEPAAAGKDADGDVLTALGVAFAAADRQDDALRCFRRLLERDPEDAAAKHNIGTVFLQQGNLADSRRMLAEALARDPALARAWNGLGVVEASEGNLEAAARAWRRAVELDRTQLDAVYNLAVLHDRRGERTEALRFWRLFADTAPAARYAADLERARRRLAQGPP